MADETLEELANKAKEEAAPQAPPEAIVTPTAVAPVLSPELQALIGDGKKYANVELALASLPHKEAHIEKLEAQQASAEQIKELLAEAKANNQAKGPPAESVGTSPTDVSVMVRSELAIQNQKAVWNANIIKIDTAFRGKYAEKGQEVYNKIAQENGMTVEGLNELSKAVPEVVLKLAGLSTQPAQASGSIKGDVNTEALSTTAKPEELSSVVEDPSKSNDVVKAWRNSGIKARKKLQEEGLLPPD